MFKTFVLNLVLWLVKKLMSDDDVIRKYKVEIVEWFRKKAKETDNPLDDAGVEIIAQVLEVK